MASFGDVFTQAAQIIQEKLAQQGTPPVQIYQAQEIQQTKEAIGVIQPSQIVAPGSIQWRTKARNLAGQIRNKSNGLASALDAGNVQEAINWLKALSSTLRQL